MPLLGPPQDGEQISYVQTAHVAHVFTDHLPSRRRIKSGSESVLSRAKRHPGPTIAHDCCCFVSGKRMHPNTRTCRDMQRLCNEREISLAKASATPYLDRKATIELTREQRSVMSEEGVSCFRRIGRVLHKNPCRNVVQCRRLADPEK